MRIFITGTNGLLGQKLIERLAPLPAYVLTCASRGANRQAPGNYSYIDLDITDADAVGQALAAARPDVVVNTAAMTNVDACEREQAACRQLNTEAVRTLAHACAQSGAQLIQLSTDFVFDGAQGPYAETDAVNPLSVYGRSKLDAETLLHDAGRTLGLHWCALRTVLVYGTAADLSRSNIVLWARNALLAGQTLNLVTDQFRTPTLAEDLAQGVHLAITHKGQGIYHIAGPDGMMIDELGERVAAYFGLEAHINRITTNTLNTPAPRPLMSGLRIAKSQAEWGYTPHTFEEGLALVAKQLQA